MRVFAFFFRFSNFASDFLDIHEVLRFQSFTSVKNILLVWDLYSEFSQFFLFKKENLGILKTSIFVKRFQY